MSNRNTIYVYDNRKRRELVQSMKMIRTSYLYALCTKNDKNIAHFDNLSEKEKSELKKRETKSIRNIFSKDFFNLLYTDFIKNKTVTEFVKDFKNKGKKSDGTQNLVARIIQIGIQTLLSYKKYRVYGVEIILHFVKTLSAAFANVETVFNIFTSPTYKLKIRTLYHDKTKEYFNISDSNEYDVDLYLPYKYKK